MSDEVVVDDDGFVQLARTFHALSDPKDSVDGAADVYPVGGALTWADILTKRRVVLLSEAGSGKTAEIKQIAKQLRGEGKPAFFLRLEHIAANFDDAFEIGDQAAFSTWLSSDREGWLLLDSIDEAKLKSPHDFQLAIRKISREIAAAKDRVNIVLTSRSFAWQPKADLAFVLSHLSYTPRRTEASADAPGDDNTSTHQATDARVKPKRTMIDVVSLDDLSSEQVGTLARLRGVSDTEALLAEIERADAWSFAARPQDLLELTDFWIENQRIGTRSEIIRSSIARRLAERDPARGQMRPLATDRALNGSRLIAAAATLTHVQTIRVPDVSGGLPGLDIREILPEWDERDQQTLLSRPVFDQQIYGSVRFHHRSVREFLAAEWFAELLARNTSRKTIETLFFREQYGVEIVVPTMRPILPWLLLLDEHILERVRTVAPEIVFEGGDPARLPFEVRRQILREVCEQMADGSAGRSMRDYTAVQRFASGDLAGEIRHLLEMYKDNADLTAFLLRMVWLGKIEELRPEALATALNSDERYERITAFRALDAVGTPADWDYVRSCFLAETGPLRREWLAELIDNAKPDAKVIDWLTACLAQMGSKEEYAHDHLADTVEKFVRRTPAALLPKLIEAFDRQLGTPPVMERHDCEVSMAFEWLLGPTAVLAQQVLELRLPVALEEAFLSLLQRLSMAHVYGRSGTGDYMPALETLVRQWPEINRNLYWFEVSRYRRYLAAKATGETLTNYWPALWRSPSRMDIADFAYIVTQIAERDEPDDRLVALSQAFDLYRNAERPAAWRRKLRQITGKEPSLRERLDQYFKPVKKSESEKRFQAMSARWKRQDAERTKKNAENLVSWKQYLAQENIEQVRAANRKYPGQVTNSVQYLFHQTRSERLQTGRWTDYNWPILTPKFGEAAALFYRDAVVEFWRQYRPKLRSQGWPGNSTANATIIGLAGLEIEAIENPEWLSSLSSDEVDLACCYASFELNGFPPWFPRLFAAYPELVTSFLMQEIRFELADESGGDASYILSDLQWSGEWAWNGLAPHLLRILEKSVPTNLAVLDRLLSIIQGSDIPDARLAEIAAGKCETIDDLGNLARWFAIWTGVAPEQSIPLLRTKLAQIVTDIDKVNFMMAFLTKIWSGRHSEATRVRSSFKTPSHLKELYLIAHQYVRVTEDYDRANSGVYSPQLRDNAQDARNTLFELLSRIPGKAAYLATMDIAVKHPNTPSRPWMLHKAKERAEQDGDSLPWSPQQVVDFARMIERTPSNHRDLAELAILRFSDLRDDIEHGDESLAALLQRVEVETEMRNFIARELRNKAMSRYSIPQEEELADAKRPDLRFRGTTFDAPVPVELKLADNWSGPDLFERLENQLCGDYLRDNRSSRGIFVLVNRGKAGWETPGGERRVDFNGLVDALGAHWAAISHKYPDIDDVTVVGIDLRKRFQ